MPVITLQLLFTMETVSAIMCLGTHVGSASSFAKDLQIMFPMRRTKELIPTHGVTLRMRERPAGGIHLHLLLSLCPPPRAVTMCSAS
jgi:hypothetical protein